MPSGYSDSEMLRMQQDAIRRVQEMQRRANSVVRSSIAPEIHAVPTPSVSAPSKPENPFSRPISHQEESHTPRKSSFSLSGILDSLKGSQDTLLILALLFVLINNDDHDMMLMLALLYLLL